MITLEMTERGPLSTTLSQGKAGFVLLLAMTVVVMFTNDSAREYLKVPIGDVHLIERDFFLYGLLALFLMHAVVSRHAPRVGRFSACALTIVALYYVSILNALWRGNEPSHIFFHVRQVNYLLVCLPFTRFVHSPARLRIFLQAALLCVLAGAILTVLMAFHYAQSDYAARNEFFWIIGGAHGRYFHVRMATAFFFVIALDVLLALWASKSRELSRLARATPWPARRNILWMVVLISLALVLTVLRSYWAGLAVSLLAFPVLSQNRLRFVVGGLFLLGVAAFLLSVFFSDSEIGRFIQEQAITSFDPDSVAMGDRVTEHYVGTEAIRRSPWIGRGLGATIVIHMQSIGQTIETSFCHDSLLTMLMFFGVLGFFLVAGVFLVLFQRGRQLCLALDGNQDDFGAALAAGCMAGVVGLLATSATAAAINYSTGFFLVGIVLGLLDVLSGFAERGERTDE